MPIKADSLLFLTSLYFQKMSRQVLSKDVLILGDSNIRRYLYLAGGAYSQTCACGVARNLAEFESSLKMIDASKYRLVIFAMMTNIVIDAGSAGHDLSSRLELIGECISPLIENLRYVLLFSNVWFHTMKDPPALPRFQIGLLC